ncbi:dna repair protein rad8, partial [Moniliophthora roreri MCA 2997]
MANKKARSSDQKSIKTFFAKKNQEKPEASSDTEVEVEVPAAKKGGARGFGGIAVELPPINNISAIFSDLVSRAPKIKNVAEHVSGRKLRVATMCSGTESPLLALELIQREIKEQYEVDLEVEHVFSCEIEPFKQAYIERNFHPPILFRDVCELGNDEAHTAYGALAKVPGDVDLLVAGTSCVDYSNLNNEKQDIDANGESGRTFRGMMTWVNIHRPPLVILENVCSAPWDRVKEKFEKNGYSAQWTRVDTKQYYIPHTRTRVYLVAVDAKKSSIPEQWKKIVQDDLRRPASSTLDEFLLPVDDPRIHQARQKLVNESFNALDRKTGRTDWGRCESRHQRARLEEELGAKRPLTSWEEGGSCKTLDFCWGDWAAAQVERVWDLMDISLLRDAKNGCDPSYKTSVWNLSQNVDRTIGSGKPGICPCLTPSMIPYITNRGGPMVGLEALSMQGLPVDKLLLTRETEDQLADLAGNAMSTTVVGACILAALITGKDHLKSGSDKKSYEAIKGSCQSLENDAMDVDKPTDPVEDHITGDSDLVYRPLDLSVTKTHTLPELLLSASKSIRLCHCEGRTDMTTRPILRCVDCNTTSCQKCGGRPEHNPIPVDVKAEPRLPPSDFDRILKSVLPMCLSLSNITKEILNDLKEQHGATVPETRWRKWSEAVLRAASSELRFVELKRQEIWSVVYQSLAAKLELHLHPQQPEWRLYGVALPDEPVNAEIRQVLEAPIARLVCSDALLNGRWEFALPEAISTTVTIAKAGELVPSWGARLGLNDAKHRDEKVHSAIHISVSEDDLGMFDRDISGTYKLLDRCGTANGALHKRESQGENLPPLFLLLDPHSTGKAEDDSFVFSQSIRRYDARERRPIIAKLDPSWRQSDATEVKVSCSLPFRWAASDKVTLKPSHAEDAQFGIPGENLQLSVNSDACRRAVSFLSCSIPLGGQAGPEWSCGSWGEVEQTSERSTFRSIAWLLERVRRVDDHFSTWQDVALADDDLQCERCAPRPPQVQYVQVGKKIVAIEDSAEAGEYERRLKRRPSPFVTQLRLQDDGIGIVRIGVNINSLLHRAVSRLPPSPHAAKPLLSWRVNTNFTRAAAITLPKFVLMSNKRDKEHAQPPYFKLNLRKEQLRSLEWMIHRESLDAAPFVEEEVAEAILDPLGWRVEGRAQREVRIKGGVLADQVGYGKTAITLGLIDCTRANVEKEFSETMRIPGKINLKATLVIVPPHLTRQWNSEVQKFTKKGRFTTLVISTVSNLNSATIEDFQNADIIIVASNIFRSNVYLENLSLLAGCAQLPSKEGRHFNHHLQKVSSSLREQVDCLQDEGSTAVKNEIHEGQKRVEQEAAQAAKAQLKRLKGKSYHEAAEKHEAEKKPEKPAPTKGSLTEKKATRLVLDSVVIPPYDKSASPPPDSSAPEDDTDDSDTQKRSKRRAATRRAIVVLSDDNEDEDSSGEGEKTSRKRTSKVKPAAHQKPSIRRRSKADDSDESFVEDTSEEEEDGSASDVMSEGEDAVPPKKKTKPTKLAKPIKKRSVSTDSGTDDMNVDDEGKSKITKKGTKRKGPEDDDRPAKKQKRIDTDPWKMDSAAVRRDWTQMCAPPFEMFHFSRKVVDEYTYLDGKVLSLVTNLTADRLWVLSGTPPIHDFGALKTISAFMSIHLGIDDDSEGQSVEVKKRRRERTDVEKFHSFREVHSWEWHAHRHELGQTFLDTFVRQNIAEIDEIPWSEKVVEITLPAAERAIYLELEHHLRALDMTIKRGRKTESDREKRVTEALGESKSAEEALLKRCSHFDLDTSNENAMKACDIIVKERRRQLEACKAELLKAVKDGVKREKNLPGTGAESMFQEWARVCRSEGIEDDDATKMVVDLIEEAGVPPSKKIRKEEVQLSEKAKTAVWEHREKTHEIRRLTKEL